MGSALTLLLLVVATMGCGRDQAASEPRGGTEADVRSCLDKAGYPNADSEPASEDPALKAATERCLRESGLLDADGNRKVDAAVVDRLNKSSAALVNCLRSQGWTVEDPKPNAQGILHAEGLGKDVPPSQQSAFRDSLSSCSQSALGVPLPPSGGRP